MSTSGDQVGDGAVGFRVKVTSPPAPAPMHSDSDWHHSAVNTEKFANAGTLHAGGGAAGVRDVTTSPNVFTAMQKVTDGHSTAVMTLFSVNGPLLSIPTAGDHESGAACAGAATAASAAVAVTSTPSSQANRVIRTTLRGAATNDHSILEGRLCRDQPRHG